MPDPAPPTESRPSRSHSSAQWFSSATVALLPVLACFLGGATEKWAEGIIVALVGLYLLIRPPRISLGPLTNVVFALLLLIAAIAFLPARWFFSPAWRSAAITDFSIALPSTLSPQPWLTAGAFVSLVAGLSWMYIVATQQLELRAVRFQLRLFVSGIVVLAALSILLYLAHGAFPFWINQRGFGPFPNRNQTANLFGITSIILLACGQDDMRHGRKRWVVWIAALAILVAAIILNFSRSGIAILVGGSAIWIGVMAMRRRSPALLGLGLSFMLLLLTALLLSGGATLERFHLRGLVGPGISSDFRWKIFHDAFELIRQSPWCGIGLANFDAVFAIFRRESFGNTRAIHPESDWLWLGAEAGWIAVALIVIGIVLIVRRAAPLQEGTNQRVRLAALIGAIVFVAHGLVDVSGHRVGTVFAAIFLLGLALHRPLELKSNRWFAPLFRLVGLILVASGLSWTVAARTSVLLPGGVGVSTAKGLATVANRDRQFNEAISLTTRALAWAPLDWQLYFTRAFAEASLKQSANALTDFRRARFLEPNSYELPLYEGSVWLKSRPLLAATAWREALRRAGPQRPQVYGTMLSDEALQKPELGRMLQEVGLSEPDLTLTYLRRVDGAEFDRGIATLLKNDPELKALSEPERLALFTSWSERSDVGLLARTLQQHPEWLRYAWLGMAKYHASQNDFRNAYELTRQFGDAVAMPRASGGESLEVLQQRYYANPDNYSVGYALYREQVNRGRIDDALLTVRHFSERPNSPAYFRYLEAQCWAEKGNWERAWNAWKAYRAAAAK